MVITDEQRASAERTADKYISRNGAPPKARRAPLTLAERHQRARIQDCLNAIDRALNGHMSTRKVAEPSARSALTDLKTLLGF